MIFGERSNIIVFVVGSVQDDAKALLVTSHFVEKSRCGPFLGVGLTSKEKTEGDELDWLPRTSCLHCGKIANSALRVLRGPRGVGVQAGIAIRLSGRQNSQKFQKILEA